MKAAARKTCAGASFPGLLGLEPAEIERRLTAQDLAQEEGVKPMPEQEIGKGKAGPGRGRKTGDNITRLPRGTSAAYLVAKLKRDHPKIARDLAAGKYRSARAAARAAGIKVDLSPLDRLHVAWRLASEEERHAFLSSPGSAAGKSRLPFRNLDFRSPPCRATPCRHSVEDGEMVVKVRKIAQLPTVAA